MGTESSLISGRSRKRGLFLLILSVVLLIFREYRLERPVEVEVTASGLIDMCLSCHKKEKLDPAHDGKVIGCASCHLGDPLAIEKGKAHRGMVVNPGDLRVVDRTCGVEGCHPTDVKKVKNSLMATNRGIIGTLLFYWGESDSQDTELTVRDLMESDRTSVAIDYFRKLCATCHLWKERNDLDGEATFFSQKGGGCIACHFIMPAGHERPGVTESDDEILGDDEEKEPVHPLITSRIVDDNCIRCHNRSGRIGLAYIGVFESEGYGTPYEDGTLSSNKMPGNRFYLELSDDIHHRRGMACIDCHTRDEVMGDGSSYAHYEDQLEISCEVCHAASPGRTRKGNLLTNLEQGDDGMVLKGRQDGKLYPLAPPKDGICNFKGHERVTCEACHSSWVPQCYGCHVKRDPTQTHLDKLSHKETEGRWEEGRSYIRYEKPMLAVWNNEIVIVTPGCQDVVTLLTGDGEIEESFDRFTMAAINPHTTQRKGRACIDCHGSTKTIGLGEGRLQVKDGVVRFIPIDRGIISASGEKSGFDQFVSLDGTPLQHGSRPDLRPFTGAELKKILRIGECVVCHDDYGDPVWKAYNENTVCTRKDGEDVLARSVWPTGDGQ
ncbi:MAG: amino acid ABC transporter substrate-binding protein [Desulfobacterales bacterium]|nr:MAG: amino acid ABC transporter substrate-binding protein [Desulfobacterales bacterium]